MPTSGLSKYKHPELALTNNKRKRLLFVSASFGGYGQGTTPSPHTLANLDTIQFKGKGLNARNLLVQNDKGDLILEFDGVADTRVILNNFKLENLENVQNGIGNIIFDGQSTIRNDFDVIDGNDTPRRVFSRNRVTFLNARNNRTSGFNRSNDVINAQVVTMLFPVFPETICYEERPETIAWMVATGEM